MTWIACQRQASSWPDALMVAAMFFAGAWVLVTLIKKGGF